MIDQLCSQCYEFDHNIKIPHTLLIHPKKYQELRQSMYKQYPHFDISEGDTMQVCENTIKIVRSWLWPKDTIELVGRDRSLDQILTYPIPETEEDYKESLLYNYAYELGIEWYPPELFLSYCPRLSITDDYHRKGVLRLAKRMIQGKPIDSCWIATYGLEGNNNHDGRHRATVAQMLSIQLIPVAVNHKATDGTLFRCQKQFDNCRSKLYF